jgi:hypothetical protein
VVYGLGEDAGVFVVDGEDAQRFGDRLSGQGGEGGERAGRALRSANDRMSREGGEQATRVRQNGAGEQNQPFLPATEAVRLLWASNARNRERLAVLDALMGALRWSVADLCLPRTIQVTDRPPNGLEAPGAPDRAATSEFRCLPQ